MLGHRSFPPAIGITLVITALYATMTAAAAVAPASALDSDPVLTTGSNATTDAPQGPQSAGTLTLDWGDTDSTPTAWKGNYAVLQSWDHAHIAELKSKNPALKILMYKDISAVRRDSHETGRYSTGLSYREAADSGWLLTDELGQILQWSDWSGLYPTDIGSSGYQTRWGSNVLAELRQHDWDGVMMDDALTSLSHSTVHNRVATRIPTDDAMYRATESFLAEVGPRIKQEGFLAVPNLTVEWDTWRGTVTDWTRYVSGWENEYFVKWGLGRSDRFVGPDWAWKVQLAAWCSRRDVPLLAITYSTQDDLAAQTYHRATWLLTWNGRTGSSIYVPEEDFTSHWLAKPSARMGSPEGRRSVIADTGVHRRDYTRGVVLVNPTAGRRTVHLDGTYTLRSGREVSQVTLRSATGRLLRAQR